VVGDAYARLGLFRSRQPVCKNPAHSQVEIPVAGLDLVLGIEGCLLYVGMAEEEVIAAAAREVIGRKD